MEVVFCFGGMRNPEHQVSIFLNIIVHHLQAKFQRELYLLQNIKDSRFEPNLGGHIIYKYKFYYIDSVLIGIPGILG